MNRRQYNYKKSISEAKREKISKKTISSQIIFNIYKNYLKKCDIINIGHRYFYLWSLAVLAKKCNLNKADLEFDIAKVVSFFNKRDGYQSVSYEDVEAAMKAYDNEQSYKVKAQTIARLCGLPFETTKRNNRKQSEHLAEARKKINSRTNKKEKMAEIRAKLIVHIMKNKKLVRENKTALAREFGLSRSTLETFLNEAYIDVIDSLTSKSIDIFAVSSEELQNICEKNYSKRIAGNNNLKLFLVESPPITSKQDYFSQCVKFSNQGGKKK